MFVFFNIHLFFIFNDLFDFCLLNNVHPNIGWTLLIQRKTARMQ